LALMRDTLHVVFPIAQLNRLTEQELRAGAESRAIAEAPKSAKGFVLTPIKMSSPGQAESLVGFVATYYTRIADERGLADCQFQCHRLKETETRSTDSTHSRRLR